MPAGCVKCPGGEIQCGSDTSELCAGSGGWTKAGALCLQFWTNKDKNGKCIIQVEVHPMSECGGDKIVLKAPAKKPKKGKKK